MDSDLGTSVMTLMREGGWVMWILLVFSIVSLALAIERSIVLRRARMELSPFLTRLRTAVLDQRSIAEGLSVCGSAESPVARVAETGLRRFRRPAKQLEKPLERRAVAEIRRMNRGLGVLATIANVAPLLGFLGTVTGMMASFEALSRFGISNPAMVAMGIKEALTTTAAGLVVAVPTQMAYNALASQVETISGDIEAVANFLLELRDEAVEVVFT